MQYLHHHLSRKDRLFLKNLQRDWNSLSKDQLQSLLLQFSIVHQLNSVNVGHTTIVLDHIKKGGIIDALETLSSVVGTEIVIQLTREIRKAINEKSQ